MTAFLNEDFYSGATANVQVWHCEACDCVHIQAASVLLTFTREEFAGFTEAVVGCHYGASFFGPPLRETRNVDLLPILVSEMES